MNSEELEIPVPWGNIAAKTYGNKKRTLALLIHGKGDNAGTFDRLIPYLPVEYYYVCIDLPGHGNSSHYPAHFPIHTISYLLTYKIIVDYFKRDKIIIIGHSWGGQMALMFTQLYTDSVLKLILLDAFVLKSVSVTNFRQFITECIDGSIRVTKKLATNAPPSYTYDEAFNRLTEARIHSKLNKQAAEALLKRCLIPLEEGKFRFSTDPRLKYSVNLLYGETFVMNLLKKYPVTCPMLIIIASDSAVMSEKYQPLVKDMLKEMRKRSNCVIKKVRGNHDVHSNQPDIIAPLICDFLTRTASKL